MTTLLELRTSLRLQLEDSGASPLFPDATLNDLIKQAITEYGRWAPLSDRTTIAVSEGATSVSLPVTIQSHAIVGVRDGTGADVRVMNSRLGYGADRMVYHEQAWRVADGTLWLQREVGSSEAGDWIVDHLTPRPLPAADDDTLSIETGDDPVVLTLGIAQALRLRSIEDYKRGDKLSATGAELARDTREQARSMFALSRRRAVGGSLDVR